MGRRGKRGHREDSRHRRRTHATAYAPDGVPPLRCTQISYVPRISVRMDTHAKPHERGTADAQSRVVAAASKARR